MKLLMETWKKFITEVETEEANVISFDFDDTLALADSEYKYIGPNEPLLSILCSPNVKKKFLAIGVTAELWIKLS